MKPQYIPEIHHTGYKMADVKATMRRNIDLRVGGTVISGKEGEVINTPLWAGEILATNHLADLDIPDAVTDLKQAIIKEQVTGEYQLATLDERFYIRLRHKMESLDKHDRDGVEGMMMELVRMRRGKIVKLADSSRLTGEMKSKITVEERVFYESINAKSSMFERSVIKNE